MILLLLLEKPLTGADRGAKGRADFEFSFSENFAGPCPGHYQSRFRPYFMGSKCVLGVKKEAKRIFTNLGWRG